jgi:hypothetical protein
MAVYVYETKKAAARWDPPTKVGAPLKRAPAGFAASTVCTSPSIGKTTRVGCASIVR